MFLRQDTYCFSFAFWFLQSISWLQTVILYFCHYECLVLFEWWVIPTTSRIDGTSILLLTENHLNQSLFLILKLFCPEMKVWDLFKHNIFQEMSPLFHLGLQKHYITALNSKKEKKIWKLLKSRPRLNTVLCSSEKRIFWGCGIFYILEQKEKVFLLCTVYLQGKRKKKAKKKPLFLVLDPFNNSNQIHTLWANIPNQKPAKKPADRPGLD